MPSPGAGLTLTYDPKSSWTRDSTAAILSWLFLWQTKHQPAEGSLAVSLRQQGGWGVLLGEQQLTGSDALAALVAASPIYARLAPLFRTAVGRWLSTLPARPWYSSMVLRAGLGLLGAACMAQAFPVVGWVLLLLLLLGIAALLLEGAIEFLIDWMAVQTRQGQPQPAEPSRPAWTPPGGYVVNAVLLVLLVYVILFNWRHFGSYRSASFNEPPQEQSKWNAWLPYPNLAFGQAVGIDQGWGLFAPRPGRFAGWYFIVGIRADGSRIDLLDGGKPIDDSTPDCKPALPSASYPNGRWRKIISHTSGFDHSDPREVWETHNFRFLLPGFCQYFYRDWNERHEGDEKVVAVQIIYWKQKTHPPGEEPSEPLRMALIHYDHVGGQERFVYHPRPMPAKPGQP